MPTITYYRLTVTITAASVPLPDAQVQVRGSDDVALYEQTTDETGATSFLLAPGAYSVLAAKAGYTVTGMPATVHMVSADNTLALTAGAFSPGTPIAPGMCRVYGWLKDSGGNPVQVTSAAVFRLLTIPVAQEHVGLTRDAISADSDDEGYWFADVVRSSVAAQADASPGWYQMTVDELGLNATVLVPDADSAAYDALVAPDDAPTDVAPESW